MEGMTKRIDPWKIIVATPSGGHPTMEFTQSLFALGDHPDIYGFITSISARVANNRNILVRTFLASDADAILFIDDDMSFRREAVDKMIEHFDPVTAAVIGGLCFGLDDGQIFTTMMYETEPGKYVRRGGWKPDSLIEVDATGGAALLIGRNPLQTIRIGSEGSEWFAEEVIDGHETGEDVVFCRRAKEAGYRIQVATGALFDHIKGGVSIGVEQYVRQVQKDKFVFVGTGRCGTGYMATLMQTLGIPCGHEAVFKPVGDPVWGPWRGDSSWLAAPHLSSFKGTVFHVVRHPLDVVSSIAVRHWFQESNPYGLYSCAALGMEPDWSDPVTMAAEFTFRWNEMIEPYAEWRIPIETLDRDTVNMVCREIGVRRTGERIDRALSLVPTDTNSNARPYDRLGWADLGVWEKPLREQAARYGYTE